MYVVREGYPKVGEMGEVAFGNLISIFNLYDVTFAMVFQISKREEKKNRFNRWRISKISLPSNIVRERKAS